MFSTLIIDRKLRTHNASIDRYEEVVAEDVDPLAFCTTYKNLYKSLGRSATCREVMNNLSERVLIVSCERRREKEKDVECRLYYTIQRSGFLRPPPHDPLSWNNNNRRGLRLIGATDYGTRAAQT